MAPLDEEENYTDLVRWMVGFARFRESRVVRDVQPMAVQTMGDGI